MAKISVLGKLTHMGLIGSIWDHMGRDRVESRGRMGRKWEEREERVWREWDKSGKRVGRERKKVEREWVDRERE